MQAPDYPCNSFKEILDWCVAAGAELWEYVDRHDTPEVWTFLDAVLEAMRRSVEEGLSNPATTLPGPIQLHRRTRAMLAFANRRIGALRDRNLLSSYALAVAEQNASGGVIVTAPTCRSAGVMPAMLAFFGKHHDTPDIQLLRALAIAGMVGATVVARASVRGPRWAARARSAPPVRWRRPPRPISTAETVRRSNTPPKWGWNIFWG